MAIVGAGPAGLMAAAVLASNSQKRVLVFDKGDEIDAREHGSDSPAWVEGVGGAGLFSDGKLCMSLDVGGHLRDELTPAEKDRLLQILDAVFRRALGETHASVAPRFTEDVLTSFGDGVTVSPYPVMHIGTDRGTEVIRMLVAAVRKCGVLVQGNCELVNLERRPAGEWILHLKRPTGVIDAIIATSVILAMGKVGAQRQSTICEQHGAAIASVPMYIGVRFECDAKPAHRLFGEMLDPKLKLHFSDGTKIKTHCATIDGEIATLRYEGLPLAGGHSYTNRSTGRSGFAILWDGIRRSNNFEWAVELMQAISNHTHGKLMMQRLEDYSADRSSTSSEISAARPSLNEWGLGNIRDFFPASFADRLDAFLRVIRAAIPDLDGANAILVAPAIEWWMRRVVADPRSMRSDAGIYVCGDGSGWSQGIIHAAATGVIAAESLLRAKLSSQQLADALFPISDSRGRRSIAGSPYPSDRA